MTLRRRPPGADGRHAAPTAPAGPAGPVDLGVACFAGWHAGPCQRCGPGALTDHRPVGPRISGAPVGQRAAHRGAAAGRRVFTRLGRAGGAGPGGHQLPCHTPVRDLAGGARRRALAGDSAARRHGARPVPAARAGRAGRRGAAGRQRRPCAGDRPAGDGAGLQRWHGFAAQHRCGGRSAPPGRRPGGADVQRLQLGRQRGWPVRCRGPAGGHPHLPAARWRPALLCRTGTVGAPVAGHSPARGPARRGRTRPGGAAVLAGARRPPATLSARRPDGA